MYQPVKGKVDGHRLMNHEYIPIPDGCIPEL